MIKWIECTEKLVNAYTERGITSNDAFDKVSYLITNKKVPTPTLQDAARMIIATLKEVKPENFYIAVQDTNLFQGLEKDLIIEALNIYLNATDKVNKLYNEDLEMIAYCMNIIKTGESKEV